MNDPTTGTNKSWNETLKPIFDQVKTVLMIAGTNEPVVTIKGEKVAVFYRVLKAMADKLDAVIAEKAFKPTHRHAKGGEYQLVEVEFHWEPEWTKKAVLYRNRDGVYIGRFEDVFKERFTEIPK